MGALLTRRRRVRRLNLDCSLGEQAEVNQVDQDQEFLTPDLQNLDNAGMFNLYAILSYDYNI